MAPGARLGLAQRRGFSAFNPQAQAVGDPSQAGKQIGPLASEAQWRKVCSPCDLHVISALHTGATHENRRRPVPRPLSHAVPSRLRSASS